MLSQLSDDDSNLERSICDQSHNTFQVWSHWLNSLSRLLHTCSRAAECYGEKQSLPSWHGTFTRSKFNFGNNVCQFKVNKKFAQTDVWVSAEQGRDQRSRLKLLQMRFFSDDLTGMKAEWNKEAIFSWRARLSRKPKRLVRRRRKKQLSFLTMKLGTKGEINKRKAYSLE